MIKKTIILIFISSVSFANVKYDIDSLKNVVKTTTVDSIKIKALNKLAEKYIDIDRDSAFMYAKQALDYSIKKNNIKGKIHSYKEYGIIYFYKSDFENARKNFNKALRIATDTKDKYLEANMYYLIGATFYHNDDYKRALKEYKIALSIAKNNNFKETEANCYNAIGILHKIQGNYEEAIEYYLKALKLAEEENNTEAISNLYNNLGVLYKNHELYDKALKYYNKSLNLIKTSDDNVALMHLYNNIGIIYKYKKEYNKSLEYFNKSLNLAKEIDSKDGIFNSYNNMGNLYKSQKKYKKAIETYNKALSVNNENNQIEGTVNIYQNIGDLYLIYSDTLKTKSERIKYLNSAIKYSKYAYNIANKINDFSLKKNSAYTLMNAYKKIGDKDKSLEYSFIYIELNQKLYDIDKLKTVNELEKKYTTEKDKILIEKLQKEQDLRNQKIKTEQLNKLIKERQVKLLVISLILLILFLLYVSRNLLKNKKLNKKLNSLNKELDNKSQEIKIQYLESVKQNIELNTKTIEIKIQREKVEEVVRQFEDTMENLEDVYFKTDRKFIYKYVSPSIKDHLEIDSFNQVIGKPLTEFWVVDKSYLKKLTIKILKEARIKDLLFKYKTTNGDIKYAKINARALFTNNKFIGIEGLIRDVTRDIEYQNKINELNSQKEVLINNIPSAIFYKDINLKYVELNNHFANLLGKPIDEIIGKTDIELSNNNDAETYKEIDIEVIKNKKPIYNLVKEYELADSTKQWISTSKIPYLDTNNDVAGIIGVVRDITDQIEYERALEESKDKIEKAHKDITDNINYAKTIQQALLPSEDIIRGYLSQYFVFFKPKEQVSGDFYFFKKFNEYVVFAAVDCTGHGVSGGFLTMLGITNLNDIVSKRNINNPAKALNLLRDKIKSTYKLFGSENKDGLDIALCALNTKTNELIYSGAFNPLWIVRDNELIEYKATRNPIGFYINETEFTSHKIQLKTNDTIYIFSDGFVDQFGGENDKKYTAKKFKQFLIDINKLPLIEQKEKISVEFNNWKGKNEQVDDVVIIGVRI